MTPELNLLGRAVARMLQDVLPAAAVTVEEGSRELAEHFMVLSEHAKAQDALVATLMGHCRDHLLEHELVGLDALVEQSAAKSAAVEQAMGDIVTDMQFQDRHSQIMENLTAILHVYGALLAAPGPQSVEAMEEDVLSVIRLREVRSALLDAARHVGLPFSEAVLHHVEEPQDDTETIELF